MFVCVCVCVCVCLCKCVRVTLFRIPDMYSVLILSYDEETSRYEPLLVFSVRALLMFIPVLVYFKLNSFFLSFFLSFFPPGIAKFNTTLLMQVCSTL